MKWLTWLLLFIIFSTNTFAFHPVFVDSENISVQDPKKLKVYYGELESSPHFYRIEASEEFIMSVAVLTPYDSGNRFNLSIITNNKTISVQGEWNEYFDNFANNRYYKGPEYNQLVKDGEYVIKVFNENNEGKYALMIGTENQYAAKDIFNAVFVMPKIKKEFFGEKAITGYNNYLGVVLVGVFIIFAFIIYIFFLGLKFYIGYR